MFDWGLLALPVLFPFVSRLPGNVVIITAGASICSFGGEGGGAALIPNPFSLGVGKVDVFHLPRSVSAP